MADNEFTSLAMNLLRAVRFWLRLLGVRAWRTLYSVRDRWRGGERESPVLVVHINAIGDFVLFCGVAEQIRTRFHPCVMELAGFDRWTELAQRSNLFSRIYPLDRTRFTRSAAYRRKYLRNVSSRSYSVVLYPAYSRMWQGDLIAAAARANQKIGYDGDLNNRDRLEQHIGNRIFTRLIRYPNDIPLLEAGVLAHFARGLGAEVEGTPGPRVWIAASDADRAEALLSAHGVQTTDPFAVIVAGAASTKRIWGVENYLPILQELRQAGLAAVFCGAGSNDAKFINELSALADKSVIDLVGKTSLPVLAAIIRQAELYIGTETGTLQIAAALRRPIICIMGGGHYGRFFPHADHASSRVVTHRMSCFGCNWKCIHDDIYCIRNITPEQVILELKALKNNALLRTRPEQ